MLFRSRAGDLLRRPGDCLSPDLERRDAVGDPLLGLGKEAEDRLAQQGQRRALRLLQGIQVLVDLVSRHSPIVQTGHLHGQERRETTVGLPHSWNRPFASPKSAISENLTLQNQPSGEGTGFQGLRWRVPGDA